MADLIDRQAAIEEIEKTINANKSIHYEMRYWEDGMNCALNIIEDIPSAEPERKRGRWINAERKDGTTAHKCSECKCFVGYSVSSLTWFNFCPWCGADMRGGEDATD